jgi:hypothetical protein
MSRLARSSGQPRPRALAGAVVVAVLLACGGGVAIGRVTSASSAAPNRDAGAATLPHVSRATLTTPHGPRRMNGALPVGFTDDKGGALSCAAVSGEALIDYVQIRRTVPPQTWIATYTTGDLDAKTLQRIYDRDPLLFQTAPSARPSRLAPRTHAVSVSDLVPVGYKVLSFSPTAAHVQVWLHGAGWSQGSASPNTVVDRSADVELTWTSGDWRITSYTNPPDQSWDGPGLDDPRAAGFEPWPGGQFTFVTG